MVLWTGPLVQNLHLSYPTLLAQTQHTDEPYLASEINMPTKASLARLASPTLLDRQSRIPLRVRKAKGKRPGQEVALQEICTATRSGTAATQ